MGWQAEMGQQAGLFLLPQQLVAVSHSTKRATQWLCTFLPAQVRSVFALSIMPKAQNRSLA